MSLFWIGLIVGSMLGACAGYAVCAMMVISKQADEDMERWSSQQ